MASSSSSILLIAGDVSGDVHTAALARKLLARDPARRLHAIGGARLREVIASSPGGEFLGDSTNCSAIGIPSAVKVYFRCCDLRERLRAFLKRHRPDLAVLCDWGAFNGRVLPEIHTLGIPVLYYFPPASWSRSGSAGLRIAPYVTRVATPFEWSAARLKAIGCDAEWVGHPALENFRCGVDRAALRRELGVAENETLLALMPGSRPSEIRLLGPRLAKALALTPADRPLRTIAVVPSEVAAEARAHLPGAIEIVTDCARDLLVAADAAVVKTGTASLEAAIAGTPQVTIYDLDPITRAEWVLLWAWKRIPYLAMPNIILERQAVPELTGLKCTPGKIAHALERVLTDEDTRREMQRDYSLIRQALGSDLPLSATERTAHIVDEMLAANPAAAV
jgi:lipid-A-disaccharide synthase